MGLGFKKEQYQFYVLGKIRKMKFNDSASAEEIIRKCKEFKPWYVEHCSGATQDFDSCIRGTLSDLARQGVISEKGSHPKEYYLDEIQLEKYEEHMYSLLVSLDEVFDFDPTDGTYMNSDMSYKLIFGFDDEVEAEYQKFVKMLGIQE